MILVVYLGLPAWAVESSWIFNGDGNWTEAEKWSHGEPVDETFDVFIDVSGTPVTVTLNESRTIGSLLVGVDNALRLEALGNTIGLTSSNGVINDGSISLTGSGSSSVAALSFPDSALANGASGFLRFQANGGNAFWGDLTNEGIVRIDSNRTATFDKPGAVYTNRGDLAILISAALSIENGTIEQLDGTFRVWSSSSTLDLSSGSTLNVRGGAFDVSGRLNLSDGSTVNLSGGDFRIGAFGTLAAVSSDVNVNLLSGGTMRLSGDVTGDITITHAGGTLDYFSGTISGVYNYLGGDFTRAPVLRHATLVIGPDATGPAGFVLEGNSTLVLSNHTLFADQVITVRPAGSGAQSLKLDSGFTNYGSVIVTGSSVQMSVEITDGALVNEYSGLLHFASLNSGTRIFMGDLVNNGTVVVERATRFSKAGGQYVNTGNFRIDGSLSVPNGGTFLQEDGVLEVNGTLSILDGSTLNLVGGTIAASGSVNIAAGSTMNLLPGGMLNMNGNKTGAGDFTQSGGTLNYTSGAFISGTYNYLGGTVNGAPRLSNATLFLGPGVNHPLEFVLSGNSTLALADDVLSVGQVLNVQGGTLTSAEGFTNDGSILLMSGTLGITSGTLVNSTSGWLHFQFQAGSAAIRTFAGNLINHGTVLVDHATAFGKSGGVYSNSGQFTVGDSQTLSITGGGTFEQSGGTLDLLGAINVTGSTFSYLGGTINGVPRLTDAALVVGAGATDFTAFVLEGNSTMALEDGLLGAGQTLTVRHTATGTRGLTSVSGISNEGSILVTGTSSGTTHLTIEAGTFVNKPTGMLHFQSDGTGSRTFIGDLTNYGTVLVDQTTNFSKSDGIYSNSGQLTIGDSQTLSITGGTFEQAAGDLDIFGTMNISGGTFRYLGGTINGAPQLTSGTLVIGLSGTSPASFLLLANNMLSGDVPAGQVLTIRNATTGIQGLTSANGFTNDGSLLLTGTASSTTHLTITDGTLVNSPTGLLHFQEGGTGSRVFSGNLTNHGTVIIDRATSFNRFGGVYSNSGKLTVSDSQTLSIINGSSLEQLDGTLDLLGTLALEGMTVKYLGGEINGTPMLGGGALVIGPNAINAATFVLTNGSALSLMGNILSAGQVITIRNTTSFAIGTASANGFTNEGTIHLTGTSSGLARLTITDGTLVNAETGLLHFQSGGSGSRAFIGDLTNHGTVLADRSTTFSKLDGVYSNSGQFTISGSGNLSITGGGMFEQVAGMFDILGTVHISGSTFRYLGGTINGVPTLSSASLEIGPDATGPASFLLIGDNTFKGNVQAGQIVTIRHNGAFNPRIQGLTSASGFTNNGTIFVVGEGFADTTHLTISQGTLVNGPTGLLRFHSGGFASRRTFSGNLTNDGTVLIDRDTTFDKPGGIYTNNGEFSIATSQVLTISGGATFEQAGGTLHVNGALALNGGAFNFLGGTIQGRPTLTSATLTFGEEATGPTNFQLQGTSTLVLDSSHLRENQTLTVGSGTLTSAQGFLNDGSISISGDGLSAGRLAIAEGALIVGATGLLHFQSGFPSFGNRFFTGDLANEGTLLIEQPTNFNKTDGQYANSGQFTVAIGGSLLIDNGGTYEQTDGTTLVNGLMSASIPLQFVGGRLRGRGMVMATVENMSAIVEPGDGIGALKIQNDYTQQSEGTLAIQLGGTGRSQYDVLTITGSATLGGTLDVSLIDGFTPAAGQAFEILTAGGGISGVFDAELLPALPEDLFWNVIYGSHAVTLAVGLPGNFSGDGVVDAADYTVWRDGLGATYGQSNYDEWKNNFGATAGGSAAAWNTGGPSVTTAVPEAGSLLPLLLALGAIGCFRSGPAAASSRRRS